MKKQTKKVYAVDLGTQAIAKKIQALKTREEQLQVLIDCPLGTVITFNTMTLKKVAEGEDGWVKVC